VARARQTDDRRSVVCYPTIKVARDGQLQFAFHCTIHYQLMN
jgi:hypothetical protein